MRQIRDMDYQYIVATDLAARGLTWRVSLVLNDDIPSDLEYFVHRVGRTGRANMAGTAITLYAPAEDVLIEKLEERGITFIPKDLKNGRIVTTYDRNRRKAHRRKKAALDPTVKGFVKKAKKKVKLATSAASSSGLKKTSAKRLSRPSATKCARRSGLGKTTPGGAGSSTEWALILPRPLVIMKHIWDMTGWGTFRNVLVAAKHDEPNQVAPQG